MGYHDLYEAGTGYRSYSFQQNAGYAAGYSGDVVLMGMPAWLASWGTSSGRGTSAQAHVQEVRYDLTEPTGLAIWDLQLTQWQDSDLWGEIADLIAVSSTVAGRHVFYNDSYFDDGPDANPADDGAIAPNAPSASDPALGKTPLLPGQAATFQNLTSNDKGINGIMVDVLGLGDAGSLGAADFEFRMGNDDDPAGWGDAPTPSDIDVRPGEGVGGSDRVTLIWPNYDAASPDPSTQAVVGKWLEVTMKATANTGLAAADVFYFGNAPGDSGTFNTTTRALVNAFDSGAVRDNPHNPGNRAAIDDFADYNRDSLVNAFDFGLVRDNPTNPGNALKWISVPAPAAARIDVGALHDAAFDTVTHDSEAGIEASPTAPDAAGLRWLESLDLPLRGRQQARSADTARAAVEELLATL
jgi:hypothetical protein